MRKIFKTTILLLLTTVILKSCTSEESQESIVSDELAITTDLADKIITTATSLNDYNFFVNNASKTDCNFLTVTSGYFNTPEGDYFSFTLSDTESFDMWLTQYNDAKLQAFNTTGVEFSDEDFFITFISTFPSGLFGLVKRESMLNYFDNCEFNFAETTDLGIFFPDISSNCDNNLEILSYIVAENGISPISNTFETIGLNPLEDVLDNYNLQNNTNYGLENLKISSVKYITPNQETLFFYTTKELTNYFEDCLLSRDASEDDCLNFVYPLEVNRFNLQLEEVITTTIENDDDLITTFSIGIGELSIIFPINLLGANGTVVTIESNEALENALDISATYCY